MRVFIGAILFLSLFVVAQANAKQKVIYGDDDRLDLYDVKNSLHVDLSKSTAAMVPPRNLKKLSNGNYQVLSKTLEDEGLCSDEKFADQPVTAACSGFLVGDDLLVTAGHCIESATDCSHYKWVFDYAYEDASHNNLDEIEGSNVYSCEKIIERKLDSGIGADYALIQLSTKVADRGPLEFRKSGKVADGRPLVVMGHPTGLPLKVADGAIVRSNVNPKYFIANLDTFGGNSGSAVFDADSGLVEGILVRGEQDYEWDSASKCVRPKQCKDTGCRG
ncbi:MAG: trypsin-like serine peptidase, partial [Bacteriovoracaceae bacterium]